VPVVHRRHQVYSLVTSTIPTATGCRRPTSPSRVCDTDIMSPARWPRGARRKQAAPLASPRRKSKVLLSKRSESGYRLQIKPCSRTIVAQTPMGPASGMTDQQLVDRHLKRLAVMPNRLLIELDADQAADANVEHLSPTAGPSSERAAQRSPRINVAWQPTTKLPMKSIVHGTLSQRTTQRTP
jgi:hypothetical protein